jgi:hypothetical protein
VRNRPPPVPEPIGLKARRVDGQVLVTWQTPFGARRTSFAVFGHMERSEESPTATELATVEGRGRRRFRARLDSLPGRRARYVTVAAFSTEFSRQQHKATAPVRP